MIDTMLGDGIISKGSNGMKGRGHRPGAMYFTDHEALKKSEMMSEPAQFVENEDLVIDNWAPKDSLGDFLSFLL